MNYKIALITDTHSGVRNDNPVFHQYQKKCFDWFFKELDKRSIKKVIHLGDIYDRRRYINFLTSKRLREDFLSRLEEREIETHIIQGNHDSYWKNDHTVNALDELVAGRYNHIHTYSVPTVINIHNVDIQLLPWITDSNKKESYEAINNPKSRFLMGHLEVMGAQMYRGMYSDYGQNNTAFEKFERVYSGHFHHRSTIGNVTYLGAFAEYTWSDFGDDRGFSIFDPATGSLEFLLNPYKMFRMLKYDDSSNPSLLEDVINKTDFSVYKDCYVKIIVVNKTNPYMFDLVFDSLYKAVPLDIQVMDSSLLTLTNDEESDIDQAEDTQTLLSKYIEGLTLPVDNSKMSSFMIEIYKEALQKDME